MDNTHPRKHGSKRASTRPPQAAMPPVQHEGPRQTRDDCTTAHKRLKAYFERGEKQTCRMDGWTQTHLEHCGSCYDFFHNLIDPDYGERG